MKTRKYHKAIPLDHLVIDPKVQRHEGVDQRRVNKMAATFDPNALGTLIVSERKDGSLVCLDGAHRRAAGQQAGYTEPVDCTVFAGLTVPDEAALFLLYNSKKDPSAVSRFKARVVAGDDVACDINDIIDRHGWKIGLASDIGQIAAVERLESVYRNGAKTVAEGAHPELVDRTLEILTEAWEYDHQSVDGTMLAAVGQILGRFDTAVDSKILIGKLQKTRPGVLIGRARALRDAQGGTVAAALAKVITSEYNNRRRSNPLPEWTWVR